MIHTGQQANAQIQVIQLTCSKWVGWASLFSALLTSSPSHPPSTCQGYCPGVFSLLTARNCINTTKNANATRKTNLTPNALYAISIYNKVWKKKKNNTSNSVLICTASGALCNSPFTHNIDNLTNSLWRLKPVKSTPCFTCSIPNKRPPKRWGRGGSYWHHTDSRVLSSF